MISPEDRQYLMSIADAIDEIEGYIQGEKKQEFFQDDMAKEDVARLFHDVGGAAKLLSDDFKAQYGDIDWEVYMNLENITYDDALEVDFDEIWSIIKKDLPILRQQVTDLAANIEEEEDIQGFDLTDDPMTH
jgi:uncharacterized protein with HEPN domain